MRTVRAGRAGAGVGMTTGMNSPARYSLYGLLSGGIILLDQWTKALVQQQMGLQESIPIIPHLFSLTYIRNPGAAFGLFVGMGKPFRTIFFLAITATALTVIGYFFLASIRDDRRLGLLKSGPGGPSSSRQGSRHGRWLRTGLALVFGGAIGNLIDRVLHGEVVDFLDFYLGAYHWPAFNVADSSITVGVSILLAAAFFLPNPADLTRPSGPPDPAGGPPSSTPPTA
jgi:signal peptidase II